MIEELEDVCIRIGNMSVQVKYSVLFMEWREPRYRFPVFKKSQITLISDFMKDELVLFAKVFAFKHLFVYLPRRSYLTQLSKSQSSAKNTKFLMSLSLMQVFSFHPTFPLLKYWTTPPSCFEFCFPPFVCCIYFMCLFRVLNRSFSSHE